jgi:peptide deformylase
MAVLPIVREGHPVLRGKAKRVKKIDASIRQLIKDMIDTMREAPGVGLAAPQVGSALRLIVVELPPDEDDPNDETLLFAICNPEITEREGEEIGEEGCLSIPGYVGEVARSRSVVVRGQDERGKPVCIPCDGYLARIMQHETDHLDGILYVDRLTSPDTFHKVENSDKDRRSEGEVARA